MVQNEVVLVDLRDGRRTAVREVPECVPLALWMLTVRPDRPKTTVSPSRAYGSLPRASTSSCCLKNGNPLLTSSLLMYGRVLTLLCQADGAVGPPAQPACVHRVRGSERHGAGVESTRSLCVPFVSPPVRSIVCVVVRATVVWGEGGESVSGAVTDVCLCSDTAAHRPARRLGPRGICLGDQRRCVSTVYLLVSPVS
jgi:hypothetical protein